MKTISRLAVLTALLSSQAAAQEFTSPSGQLGAGLSANSPEKVRLYGEASAFFRTENDSFFGTEVRSSIWAFPVVLGGGYKILPNLELEARLPFAVGRFSVKQVDCPAGIAEEDCKNSAGSFTPGNLYLGANYLLSDGKWLAKVGGAIAYGPWANDNSADRNAAYGASALASFEEFYLYAPELFSLVAPARVEYRLAPEVALTGDALLGAHIPTGGGDAEMSVVLAPGVAYLTGDFALGGRLPLVWLPTDDTAQFSLEPYARYDFDKYFASARFTLNLDDPLGFSFEEGKIWALRVGLGGSF